MERWQKLWSSITIPPPEIAASYDRERAAAYSAMLFIGTVILLITATLSLFFPIMEFVHTLILFFTAVCFGLLYGLSRTTLFRWSIRSGIWASTAILLFSFYTLPSETAGYTLSFTAIPIIVCGFLLSRRETAITTVMMIVLVIAFELVNPDVRIRVADAPLLLALTGILTVISAASREYYQQKALDSEARYRSLMEANFEGIIIIDKDNAQILDVNPAIMQMLGYSFDEFIGHYPVEFVHPDDKPLTLNVWKNRIENTPFEICIRHKQGYELTVESRLRPYLFQNEPAYVLTLLDITDRKQSEALIIESEERFRAIFNESVHYIGVLDNTGKILEFNDSAYEKFGFTPDEVLGKYLHEFDNWAHSEKSKQRVKDVIALAANGTPSRYQIQARDKDNQTIYIDFSVKPVADLEGNTRMIIAESRDTTAYHEADARRLEYEQRYESLFKDTIDAVFIYTVDGQLLDANKRAEEILGIPKEEIIKHKVLDFVAPQDRDETKQIVEQVRGGMMKSSVPERIMIRANGEEFYAETHGMVVTDSKGNPRYIQSMVRDITERKRIEEERFKTALEQERTQLLAHFIENASHHFRTPITNMKTRMYLLPRVLDKPEKREQQIDILNQELERLQNILNDLLSVLRLQKDDTEYSLGQMRVNQLLSEVKQAFEGRETYQNYQWEWQLNEVNPLIFGDKGRLGRAIINIIENAMTYTPLQGKITVRSFTRGDYIALDIIDSGKGISTDELPHIFEDFYRGQESMERDSTSSGLGLTITRMVIERHNGTVNASSPETGGAHFQILLPIHRDFSTMTTLTVPIPEQILDFIPDPTDDA